MADFGHPIVLDVGGAYVRSGLAGEHQPRHTDPSVIAKTKYMGCFMGCRVLDYYMGEAAFDRSSWSADLLYPLERGVIDWDYHRGLGGAHWDHHERLMHNAFYNSLKVAPEDHPVLMTEAMFCSRPTRERLALIMFETFMSPALYLGLKPVLALMATGATTGLVVDSGESATNVVPVYRGHATLGSLPCSITGCDLTTAVRERYKEPLATMAEGFRTHFKHDRTARRIKEQTCFVSEDYATDLRMNVVGEGSSGSDHTFLLPDGNSVKIGLNRFQIPEALFRPSILGRVGKGIHEVVVDAIVASEPHMRDELMSYILLSGGNTKMRGFANRLRNELVSMDPTFRRAGILDLADREWFSWLGGSMLGSLSTFQPMCITLQEYDEYGPTIIHRMA